MPAKKTAAKTAPAGRWKAKNATKAAVDKFEEEFTKSMGFDLRAKRAKPRITSTGSMELDFALTVGGTPSGRIIETWGPEHAGKTTLAIIMAVQHQRAYPSKRIAWVDMEQTFDDPWAEKLGLDLSKVWFYTPQTAEDVADAVKRFTMSGMCSYVALDSVGGMVSRIEMEKEADEATVGKVPQIVTRMVKICSPVAFSNGTTINVVNQVRANIGGYGPDEITGGGWALKHVTTMKLQVKRAGGEGSSHSAKLPGHEKPVPVGHQMAIKVQKNKMGPHGTVANVWLHNRTTEQYGPLGIDAVAETFGLAKRLKLMGEKGGGWYRFGEDEVRSEPAAIDYLRQHPEAVEVLRTKVLDTVKHLENTQVDEPVVDPEDEHGFAELLEEGQ